MMSVMLQAAQIAVEARKVMSASQEGELTDNYTGSVAVVL